MMTFFKWLGRIGMVVIWAAFLFLVYNLIVFGANFFDVLLMLFFLYCLLPIKHPADYPSYSDWWADRKNWLSKRT